MTIVFAIIFVAFLSYAGWTVYTEYRASTNTGWKRWLDAAEGSATILWAKFVMAVGALAGGLSQFADYLGEPSISSAIQSVLKPQYVAAFVIFVAVVTVWARKRTL